jgi:hypothetical protein
MMGVTKFESIPYWMLDAMASVISIHGIDTVHELIVKHEVHDQTALLKKLISHLTVIQTDGTRTSLD